MTPEEQCAIDALCSKWREACERADRYYANGDIELMFSVQDQMFGFLEGIRDCALILGHQELYDLAYTATQLWCYRPSVNIHRTAKEITEAA